MKQETYTKIIATIGPSSSKTTMIKKLIKSGIQSFRLNFSHGDHQEQLDKIHVIRRVCKKMLVKPTIIIDTKGPEIRTHEFNENTIIKAESTIRVFCWKEILGVSKEFSVTYHDLCRDVKSGDRLLIDDGNLTLICQKVLDGVLICKAANDHKMLSHRSVNIPDSHFKMDFISEKDREDLIFLCNHKCDWAALSFVSSANDVRAARKILDANGGKLVKICSKIESEGAITNLVEIVKISDAVMVARGDLAVEVPYYRVPKYQKEIIKIARKYQKLVIVATQMLDNMTHNLMPTRAEITDVYSAAYSGVDSCMLSGETANGDFPVQAVQVMNRILQEANLDFYNANQCNYRKLNNILASHKLPSIKPSTKIVLLRGDELPFETLLKIANLRLPLIFVLVYKEELHKVIQYYFGFTFGFFNTIVSDDLSPKSIKKLTKEFLGSENNNNYQFIANKLVSTVKE